MFSGFLVTGPGMIHNLTSFGSAEFGGMCHRLAAGYPATGTQKATDIVGCQDSGLKKHNLNLAMVLCHLPQLTKDHQRLLPVKNIFMFRATGSYRTTVFAGWLDTGSPSLKTGSGCRHDTFGLPMAVSINPATGTTSFKIVVPVLLQFIFRSPSIWPTITATVHLSRSI